MFSIVGTHGMRCDGDTIMARVRSALSDGAVLQALSAANFARVPLPPELGETLGYTGTTLRLGELNPAGMAATARAVRQSLVSGLAEADATFGDEPTARRLLIADLREKYGVFVVAVYPLDTTKSTLPDPSISPAAGNSVFIRPQTDVSVAFATLDAWAVIQSVSFDSSAAPQWAQALVVGADFGSLIHPDDLLPAFDQWVSLLGKPDQGQCIRFRIRTRENTWRWMHGDFWVIEDRRLPTVRCTLVDIDDELNAAASLRRSESRFRSATELIPLPLFGLDDLGRITFANEMFVALTGLRKGDSWWTLCSRQVWQPAVQAARDGPGDPVLDKEIELLANPRGLEVVRVRARVTPEWSGAVEVFGSLEDVTQQRQSTNALLLETRRDPLTGLANRAGLDAHLQRLVRNGANAAVLFIDLDRFKLVNDSLGHVAGDRLLQHVADRLLEAVRPGDFVARFGGDEFVVVIDRPLPPASLRALGHRLLDHIGQEVEGLGVSMRTRASIGIASTELSGGNAVSLIRNADAAMYVSKSLGSGRVTIADQRIVDAADRRLMLEAGLELALDTEEFRLMYQPIVAFGGQLIGFESLLRWTHPALGSIPPPELIAIAEDLDAGHRLTEWCVGRIVADAAAQRDLRGDAAVPLALNVSNKQLEIPGFVELMMATLGAQRLQASSIVLEVTELRPVEAASLAETVLRDCVDAGMQIVLDDFGSGNGSLEYLARIPATFLKLDRKLIGRIANQRVRSVVRCLLASCQETGVTVVAEGIETVEELAAVRDIGVEYGQGYLFAMPDSLGSFGQKSSFLPLAQV